MAKQHLKIMLLLAVVAAIGAFYVFDLEHYFTLEGIKQQREMISTYYLDNKVSVIAGFSLAYVAMTALSLPAASLLTLLAGALFGFLPGLIIVSFASTVGATLAFLMARFVMRDNVQQKYGHRLQAFNDGFEREGAFYLFALRLVPVFPFFLINLLMGLLPIKTVTYFWVSQLGMLPGTAVYVYAGTALSQIDSLKDVASPQLLAAFALLGILPVAARKALQFLRRNKSA